MEEKKEQQDLNVKKAFGEEVVEPEAKRQKTE